MTEGRCRYTPRCDSHLKVNGPAVVLFVLHSIALLWPSEWQVINRLFIVDKPISIHCLHQTTPTGPTTQFTTQPGKSAALVLCLVPGWSVALRRFCNIWFVCADLCWECREGFLFQQQRDLREYTQATIYIRKIIEDKRVRRTGRDERAASDR